MAQINPKLNLNKTPSLVDNNSLIFSKNIRLDVDGTIHRDYGVFPLSLPRGKNVDYYVNYNILINRIVHDIENNLTSLGGTYLTILNRIKKVATTGTHKIVGVIPNTNEFYLFFNGIYQESSSNIVVNCIFRYDEKTDTFNFCPCNWNYSGGVITGNVINNLRGEKILNIGETKSETLVPLKCINLNKSSITDDEQIYTQTPNIPITNLNYVEPFTCVIPNGTYQFFIRYKIREDFYTDWFPASKELFAGNSNSAITSFGTAKYLNIHKSSDMSFSFSVEHLFKNHTSNYKSFQIGFICSSDEEIVARAWKHFDFNITNINFDYNDKDAYEIEITDLIKHTYQLYDVANITSFKNKLYISNYKETNFNDNILQNYASNIKISISEEEATEGYGGYPIIPTTINGKTHIAGLNIDGSNKLINGTNGIFDELMRVTDTYRNASAKTILDDSIGSNTNSVLNTGITKYYIDCNVTRMNLQGAKDHFRYSHSGSAYSNFQFSNIVQEVRVNGTKLTTISINDSEFILQAIYNSTRYLNENGRFVNANGQTANGFDIEIIRNCSYDYTTYQGGSTEPPVEGPPAGEIHSDSIDVESGITTYANSNTGGSYTTETINSTYTQTVKISFYGDSTKYNANDSSKLLNYTTLVPYQKYKFYVHFVKQNGEITNGYYCNGANAGIIEAPFKELATSVIYPKFSNINFPNGYVACFFSILHIENNVATVFDINTSNTNTESTCMDINLGLVPGSEHLTVKQGTDEVNNAKYYYSGDPSNTRYFGANGVLTWDKLNSGIVSGQLAYVVNQYEVPEAEDTQLIKCTPFISQSSLTFNKTFDNFANMNLLGYICEVYPLSRERTIKFYTDGASVFFKQNYADSSDVNSVNFSLIELKNHLGDASREEEKLTQMALRTSEGFYIYSNYNLNYLALTEDPKMNYKSYYMGTSETTTDKNVYSLVMRLFSSITLSSMYTLPSMYKLYTRKTYSVYKQNEITEFNNTIRSSELEGDEDSINIFKFNASDYYNVPTNRGIIINMVAVGDAILVHTEDSMFKFTGSNTLQSSDGEIVTSESQPFDTGVSEVFGSDFGFAGLQNKTDHIITENGYIFFDRDSRIVYLYSGNGQIVKISDSIEKLFRHRDIRNIYFANDYYNNRFFMCVMFTENGVDYPVTLSFSTIDTIKTFVSLHDFTYLKAFNTKTKCYFLTDDELDICTINKEHKSCYTKLLIEEDKIYPSKKESKRIIIKSVDSINSSNQYYDTTSCDSIIDVIDNNNFETIKTLDSVSWCGDVVYKEFENIKDNNISSLKMAEDINQNRKTCRYMRIYSDTCMTPLNDFSNHSDTFSISNPDSYKYPVWNEGYWSFNYFRNIENTTKTYTGDQNNLIEGKYFVVRFIFNDEFKLETLNLKYNNKL